MLKGSNPVYRMKAEKDVFVKMRDGTKLACDIYRPDAPGKFPAIYSVSCYGKDVQMLRPPARTHDATEWGSIEAGDTELLVSKGYAHVIGEARGTGYSEGEYDILQQKEQEDGYDMIEWIARQPWCSGNIGMLGLSYFAVTQYPIAAQQPPHLKALYVQDGWADMYRDVSHQGGILMHGWMLDWVSHIPAHSPAPAALKMYDKKELKRLVEKWKSNSLLRRHPRFYNVLLFPKSEPVVFDWIVNEFDGPYYWERSGSTKLGKIKAATFLASEMHAFPVCMHLPGVIAAWEGIKAPKKLAIRPTVPTCPFVTAHDDVLRWFDYWLKGIDNGIMDEPAMRLWVRGANEWKFADEWPLPQTKWANLYLRHQNLLKEAPSPGGETEDAFKHKPTTPLSKLPFAIDPRPESLSYATDPLPEDVEIIGPVALYLYASLSGEDGDFIVKLKDVAPDGAEFVLSRGWLKASHRELDQKKSKAWQPYHPHTRAVPVVPDEVNEYAIEVRPIANLFKKGHRVKLEIWGVDYPADPVDLTMNWPRWAHFPYEKEVACKIYHGPEYPSRLVLPVTRRG